ncbi:MAG: hypothetical protein ACKO0N_05880 [Planctomycetota bacterium]
MKSAISKLNQSGLQLDDEAVRTIQAASRPDWNPHEQLVLVTIPDVSATSPVPMQRSAQPSSTQPRSVVLSPTLRSDLPDSAAMFSSIASMIGETKPAANASAAATPSGNAATRSAVPHTASVPRTVPPVEAPVNSALENKPAVNDAAKTALPELKGAAVTHSAIVESLVSRFAAESSCLIHFCDTDQPHRAAEVCLSVGMEYAEKIQRRVLLLDTSRNSRPMSSLLGVDLAAGFREVLRTELNWRHLVRQTSHPLVDVLPAGVIKLNTTATRSDFEFQIRKLVLELSSQYGGIFSCADTAFDLESELIGLCSSGGFLTMDFHRTSRGLAKSAANQLRASGTRLLGCIAAAESKQAG